MDQKLQTLSIGIQTFEKLINDGCLYVDKTRQIHDLIRTGSVYFLSRPRRFGKSLLISTLKAIFEGKKELFKGLWIESSDYDWKVYPIIHLSFSGVAYKNNDTLPEYLNHHLRQMAAAHDVEVADNLPYYLYFGDLIAALSKKGRVVILIDEYDKPILDCIENLELAKANRETLKTFYTVIKDAYPFIRFVLLTGVSKFSKVSVFSGLNHLNDITMDENYATMLGYTQTELESDFSVYLDQLVVKQNKPREAIVQKIKRWYNGYRFSPADALVYNPFSTLMLFNKNIFQNYWFETGTPAFLIKLIQQKNYDIQSIATLRVPAIAFGAYEVDDLRVESLLYQTGYVTIKHYDAQNLLYLLGYPNYEVEQAFLEYLMDSAGSIRRELSAGYIVSLIEALNAGDLDGFFENLQTFFADIDYDLHIKHEKYYQTVFYLIFRMLGLRIQAEVKTNKGRADAVVVTDSRVYIFEFKLYDNAESALQQIKDKQYAQKYRQTGKSCVLVGVEFNAAERNIGRWLVEADTTLDSKASNN